MSSNFSLPNRSQFFASFNQNQPFSFPNSTIYYISKNPSTSKLYQKMIQSCKYFFIKNPILVISELSFYDGWKAVDTANWININLNLSLSKLWITERLRFFHSENKNILSPILKKIYRFEATTLGNQIISFDDLLLLSSNVDHFRCQNVTVKYENGSIVPLEKIVEVFPKMKEMYYFEDSSPSGISSQTFKELLKIPQFLTLNECQLWYITELFDIDSFHIYMKTNNCTKFYLRFADSISNAYKNRLEEIIDEIIEEENPHYKVPYIYLPGMNYQKAIRLQKVFYGY